MIKVFTLVSRINLWPYRQIQGGLREVLVMDLNELISLEIVNPGSFLLNGVKRRGTAGKCEEGTSRSLFGCTCSRRMKHSPGCDKEASSGPHRAASWDLEGGIFPVPVGLTCSRRECVRSHVGAGAPAPKLTIHHNTLPSAW